VIGSHQLPSSIGGNTSTTVLRLHSLHTVGSYKSKNWVVLHQSSGVLTIILVGAALRISPEIFSTEATYVEFLWFRAAGQTQRLTPESPSHASPRRASVGVPEGDFRQRRLMIAKPTAATVAQRGYIYPQYVRYNSLEEYGDRTI
jgi:hypothetical protein